MQIYVDTAGITRLFEQAQAANRNFLFEYEVYEFMRLTGSETVPQCVLLPKGIHLDQEQLLAIPGDTVVLKIVSPLIVHKSDVGGVRIVHKELPKVLSAVRGMLYDVPEQYAQALERHPEQTPTQYAGLRGDALKTAILQNIQGVLLCQFMPGATGFGNELIVSLRRTREFGMILSAGLGGTDTELYAHSLRKGQSVVAASTAMTDGDTFFKLFQQTIAYKALTGQTRGHKRLVTDEQLLECFAAFIALGNYFSPLNPDAPFIIEDLEINPFAFADYLMMPLDGLCRFSLPQAAPASRPVQKIDKLLHPASIIVCGVSAKEHNVGRIIVNNILGNGFPAANVRIIHPTATTIDGVAVLPTLDAVDTKCDLMILAVSAEQIPDLVTQITARDLAESVILIPGGMGEVSGSEERSAAIRQQIQQVHLTPGGGPIFLGGNSLGLLSHPGQYDSMFISETLLPKQHGDYPRKTVIISQSGGYMISRMSKLAFLDPAYAISLGNQFDVTVGDIMAFFAAKPDIPIVACYMEGFNELDGVAFVQAIRAAVQQGQEVIFYKAGRTPEGKTATSGHTASLAGDYMVCESCARQAGAMVADTFIAFEGLLRLSYALHAKTIHGNRVALISNAGYESVGMADHLSGDEYALTLASLSPATREILASTLKQAHLDQLVNLKNPLDLTPMATDDVYVATLQLFLDDPQVDVVMVGIVPLTSMLSSLTVETAPNHALNAPNSLAGKIAHVAAQSAKPVVIVIDSGVLFDPLAEAFQSSGLPVFRSADQAMENVGQYVQDRLQTRRK